MRIPIVVLLIQVAVGVGFVAFVLLGGLPGDDTDGADGRQRPAAAGPVDRFDGAAAFRLLERQLRLGPRPAGSTASRRLARLLKSELPRGRYQPVPGGLRNVVGRVEGREPQRVVVVGAHYDTKDIRGFVGANDGAGGTAVLTELARTIRPRTIDPTLVFIAFDGEESPRGTPDERFAEEGLRGSRVAAKRYSGAEAMILLDYVGDRRLSIPREASSDAGLWEQLRSAARRAGALRYFPPGTAGGVLDDHTPFLEQGVPAIDLIDFDFPCFHRTCDDLGAVSERSVDAVGETVLEMLRRL